MRGLTGRTPAVPNRRATAEQDAWSARVVAQVRKRSAEARTSRCRLRSDGDPVSNAGNVEEDALDAWRVCAVGLSASVWHRPVRAQSFNESAVTRCTGISCNDPVERQLMPPAAREPDPHRHRARLDCASQYRFGLQYRSVRLNAALRIVYTRGRGNEHSLVS